MSASADILRNITRIRNLSSVVRREFTGGRIYFNKPQQPSPAPVANVPGLSEAVLHKTNEPVGPGVTKDNENYKNPEYYCYHKMSYHEAEIEMAKYRLPQPDNTKFFKM